MATKNIVPRGNGEGSIGRPFKKWGNVYTEDVTLQGAAGDVSLQEKIIEVDKSIDAVEKSLSEEIAKKVPIAQGVENAGKNLVVDEFGNVGLGDGGGHKIVDEIPSVEEAEENVVYFVPDENNSPLSESSLAEVVSNLMNRIAILEEQAGVVESGEGYIRYANGLQVCWDRVYTMSWNSFAKEFKDVPSITANFCSTDNYEGAGRWSIGFENLSTTQFYLRGYYIPGGADTPDYPCSYIAIGRWK